MGPLHSDQAECGGHYTPGVEWLSDYWLDTLGWGGSALLVYSLLQSRVLRLRWLNLVACAVLVIFNAALDVWPMVAMNVVLCAINLWFIVRLTRERHDARAFTVLPVGNRDAYLHHVLAGHTDDIARFQPDFDHTRSLRGADVYLVQHGDETVGVVVLHRDGATAHVVLDYVTPRFRDFSPGEFVWRHSALLRDTGIRRVLTHPGMVNPYYAHVGFERDGEAYALDL